jgi:Transposase DDE domain
LGLLLRVRVTAGDVGDRDGAAMLLHDARTAFPRLQYGWVDAGYRGAFLDWAREVAGITLQVASAATVAGAVAGSQPMRHRPRCPGS